MSIYALGHNTKFISDQYVKMVNICIGFGTYIGTFSSCSDAYIHEVHYWKDDGVWGSTLWHHNFEIKGSELHVS